MLDNSLVLGKGIQVCNHRRESLLCYPSAMLVVWVLKSCTQNVCSLTKASLCCVLLWRCSYTLSTGCHLDFHTSESGVGQTDLACMLIQCHIKLYFIYSELTTKSSLPYYTKNYIHHLLRCLFFTKLNMALSRVLQPQC